MGCTSSTAGERAACASIGSSSPSSGTSACSNITLPDWMQDEPLLRDAVDRFNAGDCDGAIELLDLTQDDNALAAVLLRTVGIDVERVVGFLGEARCQKILCAFLDQFDFAGVDLVAALRNFLSVMPLKGEAQKLDRIICAFAERFAVCNQAHSSVWTCDSAYIIAFALLQLHSDLHNPAVKKKMSLPAFKKNLSHVNGLEQFTARHVESLYRSVSRQPLWTESSSAFSALSEAPSVCRDCSLVRPCNDKIVNTLQSSLRGEYAI